MVLITTDPDDLFVSSAMAKGVSSAAEQVEQLKKDRNLYFKKNRLGAAIDAYTEAITLCPNVPVYWTNRALCHCKRKFVALVAAAIPTFGYLSPKLPSILLVHRIGFKKLKSDATDEFGLTVQSD